MRSSQLTVSTYRSLAGFAVLFEGATLELLQLDGGNAIEPQRRQRTTSAGILFPGQRMDLVIHLFPQVDEMASSLTVELDQE
jgi:hypothetical protein